MKRLPVKTARALAQPYAQTAFTYAVTHKEVADWDDKLRLVADLFDEETGDSVLHNPQISKEQATNIINQALDVFKVTAQQRNFINLLISKDHLELIPWVYDGFRETCKQALAEIRGEGGLAYGDRIGFKDVKIVSAEELSPAQLGNLKTMLRDHFKARAEPQVEVDPSLGSGVKLIIGGRVYDQTAQGAESPKPANGKLTSHKPARNT
jgi:F0F1-type ATP synthase delta subunit